MKSDDPITIYIGSPGGHVELLGRGHGYEMYQEGYFAHESPITGDVGDRLADAGITFGVGWSK